MQILPEQHSVAEGKANKSVVRLKKITFSLEIDFTKSKIKSGIVVSAAIKLALILKRSDKFRKAEISFSAHGKNEAWYYIIIKLAKLTVQCNNTNTINSNLF